MAVVKSVNSHSADSPMDYEGLSTVLSFAACDERSCVNVTIVDDLVDEQIIETFTVTLGRTTDLDGRIMLNPVNGLVEIECNDGKSLHIQ